MYHCGICKTVTKPRVPQGGKVVISYRPHRHPARAKANRRMRRDDKWIKPDDPGGEGLQISREVSVCPACFEGEMEPR